MVEIAGRQVTEKIYESGTSLVYRTHRDVSGAQVILKVLKQEYPSRDDLVRYRQEYEITRALDHFAVIRVFGLERYRHTLVLLVEDFGGVSLDRRVRRAPLGLADFFLVAEAVTRALEHVHAAGVVHRDVNPANIIWNPETRVVKLIDFGIATRLVTEQPRFQSPRMLEGTLRYISPEQTGRMNRRVDHRTDLYALGATFYELLTGHPPFEAEDPTALVHAHLARAPKPVDALVPGIPKPLSALVQKLLAKNAEDRYQSASGLLADLLAIARLERADVPFELGTQDRPVGLQLPQKLYGRQKEIAAMLQAFQRISAGGPAQLLLVAGASGSGKSSLVREVHRPITLHHGLFASGKFEQLRRDVPYSAFAQAFREVALLLLAEPSAELAAWRARLLERIGHNGRVLMDLVPEFERVLGPQPPVPEVGAREQEHRLTFVVVALLEAVARPESPLVLFLDDLQWADLASLRLLTDVLRADSVQNLLIIGAYRSDEVDALHPLTLALGEVAKARGAVETIHVEPLGGAEVEAFLRDATRAEGPELNALALEFSAKTRGNPFHMLELLKSLYGAGLFRYDVERRRWTWTLEQVRLHRASDNVIAILAAKLGTMSEATREVLEEAACIGFQFDIDTLSIGLGRSRRQVLADLWPAMDAGLVLPLDTAYKSIALLEDREPAAPPARLRFLHDRVQQATDLLLSDAARVRRHFELGRRLLEELPAPEKAERICEIADHLDLGRAALEGEGLRRTFAETQLAAGRRARTSGAHAQALRFFRVGAELLPPDASETEHALWFELTRGQHECEYLLGHYQAAEALAERILVHASDPIERAEVHEVRAAQYSILGDYARAIQTARDGLAELEVAIPGPGQERAALEVELVALAEGLDDDPLGRVLALEPLRDPRRRAIVKLLTCSIPAAYFANLDLWAFLTARVVAMALREGSFNELPFSLANLGVIWVGRGEPRRGHAIALAAVELSERINSSMKSRTFNAFALCVNHWTHSMKDSIDLARRGHLYGVADGDLEFASYCHFGLLNALLGVGAPVEELLSEAERAIQFVERQQNAMGSACFRVVRQFARALLGETSRLGAFDDADFSEAEFLASTRDYAMAHAYFFIFKAMAENLAGDPSAACAAAAEARKTLPQVAPFLVSVEHSFHEALALLARAGEAEQSQRRELLQAVEPDRAWLQKIAAQCPENFRHKSLLVEAEHARVVGESERALRIYLEAIEAAHARGAIQDEALAHELAARHTTRMGLAEYATLHITNAHYAYGLWGARRKVLAIEAEHPAIPLRVRAHRRAAAERKDGLVGAMSTTTTASARTSMLDLESVLEASQSIAREIVLDRLLSTLMRVVLENAGADRGVLFVRENGDLRLQAEGRSGREVSIEVGQEGSLEAWEQGPRSLVRCAARTGEVVVLDDALLRDRFLDEPYFARHRVRSVLALPVVKQAETVGVVYLENSIVVGAFDPERLTVLGLLAGQMAISLENARLHALERAARAAAEHAVTVREDFLAIASHELKTPITSLLVAAQTLLRQDAKSGLAEVPKALVRRSLENMERQAKRLSRLVNALLDVSKIGAGRLVLSPVELDLAELAEAVVRSFEAEMTSGSTIVLEATPTLGSWDRLRLEQVIANLLSNAIAFGKGAPIHVKVGVVGDRAQLSVRDQGIGIAPADQEKIFERFERAVSARHYGGLGLGLYICREIVRAHGGRLTVQSALGQGATFTMELPRASAPAQVQVG